MPWLLLLVLLLLEQAHFTLQSAVWRGETASPGVGSTALSPEQPAGPGPPGEMVFTPAGDASMSSRAGGGEDMDGRTDGLPSARGHVGIYNIIT